MVPKILIVAHVFYPQHWNELLGCIRTIGASADVIVTYVEETSVVEARKDLPWARFLACENRGFDIWPFVKALESVDLGAYECVVKLHTKRDIHRIEDYVFNNCRFTGSAWREYLLSFCKTPEAWRRTLARLSERDVGMVADRHVIVRRRDLPWPPPRTCFDEAVAEIRTVEGCLAFDEKTAQYVSGTMFAARTEPLRFLLKRGFAADWFDMSGHERDGTMRYAHVVENLLGLSVSAVGMRLVAFNGALWWRRLYAPFLRFVYRYKDTRRKRLFKVFGLTVAWRTRKDVS